MAELFGLKIIEDERVPPHLLVIAGQRNAVVYDERNGKLSEVRLDDKAKGSS